MELHTARQIIDTLSQGIHPATGEAMAADSPYNDPSVIRALFTVSQALEAKPARPRRDIPPNAGKPWDAQDDAKLESAHREGLDLKQVAEQLGRTPFGVETRLVKLGHLAPRSGMRFGAPAGA